MASRRVSLVTIAQFLEIPAPVSAAIVAQVAARLERWMLARHRSELIVPRLADLTLERGGRVWWYRGRKVPAASAVRALGTLLDALLACAPQRQIPPGLLYVVSRAVDERHLAPVQSVRDFAAAVARHASPRPLIAVDALVARYSADRAGARPLGGDSTISDVRRRRRAGGISLGTIARDTGIPISLLRELEWGVYENWLLPHAESSVTAYAERSGLDPRSVLSVLSRDQFQLAPPVPVRVGKLALLDRTRGLESRHRTAPFALAAALVAMLSLATPSDPVRSESPVDAALPVASANVDTFDAVDESGPRVTVAADAPPPGPQPASVARPRARGLPTADAAKPERAVPVRRRELSSSPQPRPPQRTSARNPILRLAHTIAGDGTHRVQPFPRPADH